jgi:hypothetical protein
MTTPVAGQPYSFTISLMDTANPGRLKTSPTLTAGDFKVSVNDAALTNLAVLPTETPAGSGLVVVRLQGAEVGLTTVVRWSDPDFEWGDGSYSFTAEAGPTTTPTPTATAGASTVRDLITAALLDLGAIASGESPTAAEAQDAFRALNNLLESWRLESLMAYAVSTVTKVLTGATSYTLGPGGDINTTRPVRLEKAELRLQTDPTLDYPLRILTDAEYEAIALKGMTSTLASALYMDRAYPLANVYLWPVQAAGATLLLYPWTPLTAFASLDSTVSLPPGYARALQKNLSLELAPQYRDCVIPAALAAQALAAKALLKTINARPRFLQLPAGLPTGRRRGTDRAAFLGGWI